MRWLGLAPLFCLLCACDAASVLEAPNTIVHNECHSDADCSGGSCIALQCRSKTATYQTVLLEVTPPADGSAIAGVQFQQKVDLSSGDPISLDLGLISQVAGEVKADALKCMPNFVLNADDFSVPARVSLIPTSSALGLYSPRAVVQSDIVLKTHWGFSMNVAPGTYDIYVEPNRQSDETCPVPPQLLRGKEIKKGTVPLDIALPEPSLFEFHVTWTGEGSLDGWMVDMLDPVSARVISNRVPLVPGPGGSTDYVANVSYNPVVVVGDAKAQPEDQLLRLSPPDGLPESDAKPTVLMARSALGLFAPGRGTLTDFTSVPTAVHVHGQVTSGNTPNPTTATVTLVATKIAGIDPGVLASFVRTVSVGSDGQFDVYLLPGTYRVSTVPLSPLDPGGDNPMPLAADTREWLVPSTPVEQAGKVIALGPALPITGRVVDASGRPVATAQVQAVASLLSIQSDILQESLGGSAFVPRASAGGVNSDGNFAFRVDPGTFDITVRPNSDTGFAWLVMPNLLVTAPNGIGLEQISMPLPVPYGGTVTVGDGAQLVPGALVRAYIYLEGDQYTSDDVNADSVLQVAETRTDNGGNFEILIPAELNRLQ